MGRSPCCQKVGLKRGRWTAEEDQILIKYIQDNGEGSWRALPKNAGLLRCGKSCRLRWINYLRTDLKRGNITPQEEDLIIKLHATIGNRWSLIATQLPGRTDNEIKNHWNSHLSRSITTWRRPANDTLPKHILENLAKLMTKSEPSIKKECKKNAPIKTIATDRDVNHKTTITHEMTEDNNNMKLTMPVDGFNESVTSNNNSSSWSTDQSFESIFALENHQDLVEVDNVDGLLSLNEKVSVTPAFMDHMMIMVPDDQLEHASNDQFQTLDDGAAIDIDQFMNDLMNNLDTLNPSTSSSTSHYMTFKDPTMNNINNDRRCWDQDEYEEVGSSFLMPWLWDYDDVDSYGL